MPQIMVLALCCILLWWQMQLIVFLMVIVMYICITGNWKGNPKGKRDKHRYKQMGIEEKESYKWIASSKASQLSLAAAKLKVIIQGSEGYILTRILQLGVLAVKSSVIFCSTSE